MKRIRLIISVWVACCLTMGLSFAQPGRPIRLVVDGSRHLQTFDGIGVNTNTRSWSGKELVPAMDLLLDSLHATIWRVIVETVEKWEEVNDNSDPFVMNADYYNRLYETPKFQKAWEMIRYLNQHGITDKLMINFMGFAPTWMGVKVIKPEFEDEYVEMITSFFYYAIKTKHLQFGLISPTNESDHHQFSEGPHLDAQQHARILHKLILRMQSLGILGNIRFVAPDAADTHKAVNDFIPAMMQDTVVMSRLAHVGLHSYGSEYNYGALNGSVKNAFPNSTFWMTEWNQWCEGCDNGILGEYDFTFAQAMVYNLLQHLRHGASAGIVWEGYDSYYEHHAPSPFSYWGVLGYDAPSKTYTPRKHFYALQQVSRFVAPGSYQVPITGPADSLSAVAFVDPVSGNVNVIGINRNRTPVTLQVEVSNVPGVNRFELVYTSATVNLKAGTQVNLSNQRAETVIPPGSIFTLTGNRAVSTSTNPEPSSWYAGDIHVHRNCGDNKIVPYDSLAAMMAPNNLSVISMLADMGNGEVKESAADLLKVNGTDSPLSAPGRIIHWDTEWHWDAVYSQFAHQALGGHLVLLGLTHANQIWEESPYSVLDWAKKQNAVRGFAHFQYLNNTVQEKLDCCIPIDYPVEAALGNIDFISEDVTGSEAAMQAYYRLLNCGFRLGLAAGTDFPCNGNEPLGTLLTYVNIPGKPLTYANWIEGIGKGRTVISRNGHREFLDLKVNQQGPGDEIKFTSGGKVNIVVTWSAASKFTGQIEIVSNGKVIARKTGTVKSGEPLTLQATQPIEQSSWICARRSDETGHRTHTAPVYITVGSKPVRASAEDAGFFVAWIDTILNRTKPGGEWSRYFTKDLEGVKAHYQAARKVYLKIRSEATELKTRKPKK